MMRLALFVVLMLCATMLHAERAMAADQPLYAQPAAWVVPAPLPNTFSAPTQAAARWLLADDQLKFDHGTTRRYQETLVRIQTPQGLDAEGTITLLWDPATEILTIHKLHILRAGAVIDLLAAGQTFTILRRENNLEGAVLDGRLTAVIQPAGLQVGDILDLSFSIDATDPAMHGMAEWTAGFAPETPLDHLLLRASWPTATPIHIRASPTLPPPRTTTAQGLTTQSWAADNLQPLVQPEQAPSRFLQERQVAFSQFASWAEVARQFAPLYDHAEQLTPQSPLTAEIARIKAATPDPAARATAALALVQDRVHYVFLGMNDGGLVPANADLTWLCRFGDCKGKTVLLLALLHGLGIEAAPVLVNTEQGDGLAARLPMAHLFDHVLVRAIIASHPYWLDGTRSGDSTLANIAIPAFYWGLKLAPDTTALLPITPEPPAQPLEATTLRIDARAGLDKPAPFHGEVIFRGDSAIQFNQALADLTPDDQDRKLRHSWSDWYDFLNIDRVSAAFDPATGQETLLMDGHAQMRWSDHRYEADDAGMGYDAHFERAPGPAHDAPYTVGFPGYRHDTETILLPTQGLGYALDAMDRDQVAAGMHFLQKSIVQNNVFVLQTEVRSLAPEFPASDAPAAQAALRDMALHTVYLRSFPLEAPIKPASNTDTLFSTSNSALSQGRNDDAIAGYNKLLALDARNADAWADRGIAYQNKHDLAEAKKDFAKAISLDPHNAVAARGYGILAYDAHDFPEAVRQFTLSVLTDPANNFAFYKRAQSYVALGNSDLALADMNHYIAARSDDAGAYMMRGLLFMQTNRPDKAIPDLTKAIALAPKSVDALAERGLAHSNLGDKAAAAQDFQQAARLDPQNALMRSGRGLMEFDTGNYAAAITDLSAALDDKTGNALGEGILHNRRARSYLALHQDAPALADTDDMLRLQPHNFYTYGLRANIYLDQHNSTAALRQAPAAIAAAPADPASYTVAGSIYGYLHDDKDAAAAFTRSLAIAPTANTYLARARYRPAQDLAGRKADIDAALRLDPQSKRGLGMRAGMQERAGDFPAMLKTLQVLIDMPGSSPDLLSDRGYAHVRMGQTALATQDFATATARADTPLALNELCWREATANVMLDDALKHCDASVALTPTDAAALDSRGFVLLRLHRYAEAIAAYDAALKIAPQQADSLYGRGIAEQRLGNTTASATDLKAAAGQDDQIAAHFASYGVSPG